MNPSLGERVRQLRLDRQWSKKHLSRLTGIPVRTIQRIEKGETPRPHDDTLQILAHAFEVNWHELQAARDREVPDASEPATISSDIDETMPVSAILSDSTQTESAVHAQSEPRRRFGAIRGRPVVYLVVAAVVVLLVLAIFMHIYRSNKVSISGTVQCTDNERVVGVWVSAVNDTSGSNFAKWYKTNSNGSEAAFTYDLPNGDAYNVHVGCGGSTQDWENTDYTENGSGSIKNYHSHYFTCQDVPLKAGHGPCYLKQ